MRIWRRYAAAAAAAIAGLVLLAYLPSVLQQQSAAKQKEVAVFRAEPIKRLTNSNMVDAFIALQLNDRLMNVKWDHAILTVELLISGNKEHAGEWFQDAWKIIRLSFAQTENVNRLIIRFKAQEQEEQGGNTNTRMLFAMDVRRSDSWLQSQINHLEAVDPLAQPLWKKRLRLNFSPYWESAGEVQNKDSI